MCQWGKLAGRIMEAESGGQSLYKVVQTDEREEMVVVGRVWAYGLPLR